MTSFVCDRCGARHRKAPVQLHSGVVRHLLAVSRDLKAEIRVRDVR
jgi:hypothetical protein